MSKNSNLSLKLKALPESPGVYQYLDTNGIIIYVGKAKNLKKRVSSYFSKTQEHAKTRILVSKIIDLHYIIVDSEIDALLLENNLIKKYQPKYNIQLKDDKTYPWICIKNEPFPRVFSTRKLIKDGSAYYGPYPNGKVMMAVLELIKANYTLRTCSLDLSERNITQNKFKVCLEYHIGNCLGPCTGKQSKENYSLQVNQIEGILKGNVLQVINHLKEQMNNHAAKQEYEAAHQVKTRITALENYKAKSTIVSPSIHEVDVCGILNERDEAYVNFLSIQNGAIIHAFTTVVKKKLDESDDDVLGFVLLEMRERFKSTSKEVLVAHPTALKFPNFKIVVPQRGEKKNLIDLSLRNATFNKIEQQKQEKIINPEKHTQRILNQIKKDFRLNESPVHMECFDNSNIQGTNPVSACVVFKNGKPSKKDYRHFNIQSVEGPNDFASMEEVVYRRYKRLLAEEKSLPQLVIIDGGKGQLSAALKALEHLNIRGKIAIVGIAKKLEEIFFPGDNYPIYLDKRSESLKLIQHMRNEAHRFGITHHRNRRSKGALISEITLIHGIGPANQKLLIQEFKTIKRIKEATLKELISTIGETKGAAVFKYFHPETKNQDMQLPEILD
jgi:excinuclease ABC subunit C